MFRTAALASAVTLLVIGGCSSESETPSSGADTGSSASDAGADAGSTASTVASTVETPAEPMPVGNDPLPPVIDGSWGDWSVVMGSMTDAAGDASGGFDVLKMESIASNGRLGLRLELGEPLNLQSGPEEQGTLIIEVAHAGDPEKRLGIDMRERSIFSPSVNPIDWGVIDFVSAPTHASTVFEMSFDVRPLGVSVGDELVVTFSGSDDSDEALSVTAGAGPRVMRAFEDPRKSGSDFRVVGLNTLRNGAFDERRAPILGRMLDAMDPDIICLQEEWDSEEAGLQSWIEGHDPLDDGASWRAQRVGGNVIMAPAGTDVEVLPASGSGFTIATVEAGARKMIIAAVHLKCCGYAGSSEDNRRITQANSLIAAVEQARSRADAFSDAPFVLIGDWNLVGSGGARDVVCDHPNLNAVDLAPMRLRGDRNTTWRDLTPNNGGFPPGRLDLIVVSESLPVKRSFVFDTVDVDAETLGAMDLNEGDATASDHLMLVLDVE